MPPRTASDVALHVADHRGEIRFDHVDGFADRGEPRAIVFFGIGFGDGQLREYSRYPRGRSQTELGVRNVRKVRGA